MQGIKLKTGEVDRVFYWSNPPHDWKLDESIAVSSSPNTDYWQRTHYGFRRDDGHFLATHINFDFNITVRTRFEPHEQYDQCGLMVRIDPENWIKTSIEYETPEVSRLGSVVTNLGYSDWATTDIASSIKEMWYRIQSKGPDFLIEHSQDGKSWQQLRIAHLHSNFDILRVGIYACSPKESSFISRFDHLTITDSNW